MNKLEGVQLGSHHTLNDWGLYLKGRPTIGTPEPKTNYVDIPGADGSIDMTQALTGDVQYKMRTLSFDLVCIKDRADWAESFSTILDAVHGQQVRIIFDNDPEWFYRGRVTVNEWKSDKATGTIAVSCLVEPYKYAVRSTLDPWLWDDTIFSPDYYIQEFNRMQVDGEKTITIVGGRQRSIPTFDVETDDDSMTVEYNGNTYTLHNGKSQVLNIVIEQGENPMTFRGWGTVTVDYRRGRL